MSDYDLVVSYSQLEKFLRCERQWAYSHAWKWKPEIEGRALSLGTEVHNLLHLWWTGNDSHLLDVSDVAVNIADAGKTATLEECVSIAEHALWLMKRYDKMYARDRGIHEPVAIEQQETVALPQYGERRYGLTVKIDMLLDSAQYGGLVLMDHKTMGSWTKEDALDTDPQWSLYFWALRELGIDIVLGLLDAIYTYRWTKQKKVVEWDSVRVEDSFRRAPVDRSARMLEVAAYEAYKAADRMWAVKQGEYPLRSIREDCSWCDFRGPCYEALQGAFQGEEALLRESFSETHRRPVAVSSLAEEEVML